ncbi:Clp protease N-terminal domain-containing protein [Nonomuraea rhodomycinica]|uniref:Clp R domain-containing protein n=1 Tax=Nonomuraea rhodomycinica TaxID=1712872 RepID=A0A7Y6IPI8_9ACTN|nr:Clp protease N-terminal domain-containing protein [Nonomuraea rhodomycinica]NUW42044.1 hypothetical protein [Nonomuraea rhodomycinica]
MFEKFTDRARNVVVLSQEEARMLNHDHLGTEHILLGLIREGGGVGAAVLVGTGLTLDEARRQVEESQGRGRSATPERLAFTPPAIQVLQGANQESLQRGLDYVGTEHILLALVRDSESVAARLLVKHGADLDQVARSTDELVRQYTSR